MSVCSNPSHLERGGPLNAAVSDNESSPGFFALCEQVHQFLILLFQPSASRIFSTQGSNPGIEPRSPALQADSLQAEPPGNPSASRILSISSHGGQRGDTVHAGWHHQFRAVRIHLLFISCLSPYLLVPHQTPPLYIYILKKKKYIYIYI